MPTLIESIAAERAALEGIRARAEVVLDTAGRSVHDLRATVQETFGGERTRPPMRVSILSFGFKRGVPQSADMIIDVRFLPNPYWEASLRDLTGLDRAVRDYVLDRADTVEFLEHLFSMCSFLLPRYEAEGKAYLTLAFGCTGGRHRSVAIAERLSVWLREQDVPATVNHRDIEH
jgi:UPF0042 nucleotide-binding protein